MLINLSNHPTAVWTTKQLEAARELYGRVEDMDFPQINPSASTEEVVAIATEFAERAVEQFRREHGSHSNAVHVMGEMCFVYAFVDACRRMGVACVASTTRRSTALTPGGAKTSVFEFVGFRRYF